VPPWSTLSFGEQRNRPVAAQLQRAGARQVLRFAVVDNLTRFSESVSAHDGGSHRYHQSKPRPHRHLASSGRLVMTFSAQRARQVADARRPTEETALRLADYQPVQPSRANLPSRGRSFLRRGPTGPRYP